VVDIVDNGGACLAQQTDIVVEAVDAQNFSVLSAGSSVLCAGDPKKVLQVSPTSATYSYQWFKDNVALPNPRVYDTLQVSSTGEYFVKVTSGCGTPFQANTIKVTVASVPVASFTTDPVGSACQGQNIKFTSTSTGISNDLTPTYSWTFASGKTSTEQSPSFKYDNAGGANPSLVVSYSGACPSAPSSVALTINPAPVVKITNTDHAGIFEFCDGESITLAVPGTFVSYAWSTGESTSSIFVTEAGNYTVEVKTASCTLNAEQVVTTSKPNVLISADPVEIEEGKSSQLTASGLVNYIWSPADALSDATIANPVASPVVTTVYSVTGKDDKGCTGLATLQLLVKGEPIVNKLLPANFFSPNKDGNNDAWKVDNIKDYPQCNIAIYDEKGIKVYEAKPYNEDWDGTIKGKRLPDGVYYFIIRCDGEESKPRSGSITLLR
jgi:gliding motility-associated-like protein